MSESIPIAQRFAITVNQAAQYFGIGENKLRKIINSNKEADYILWNGARPLIKRECFERFLNEAGSI